MQNKTKTDEFISFHVTSFWALIKVLFLIAAGNEGLGKEKNLKKSLEIYVDLNLQHSKAVKTLFL